MSTKSKAVARQRRHRRLRKRVHGTAERPRLVVYRSNVGIYAQIIDDDRGHTLVAASSLDRALPEPDGEGKSAAAASVGKLVAQRAVEAGITAVVFDRGGNRYHGRVKALADGARDGGLAF